MKKHILLLATATANAALAQGPLTPPGAPAPTMKTLDQIEARTPIESLPYTISTSGSYYFTKNLLFTVPFGNAINITTGNVTLDLNGFTLNSPAGVTGIAISVNDNLNNIAIKNGHIASTTTVTITGTTPNQTWASSGAGLGYGIYAHASSSRNMTVNQIQVSGCRNDGIYTLYGSVENSTATSNGNNGIYTHYGSVTNSTATSNGNDGIYTSSGSVTNSTARANGGTGIYAQYGSVTNSAAHTNGNIGISASSGSVTNSTARANGGTGIYAQYGSVTNATARFNGGDGIYAHYGSVMNCVATSNNTSGENAVDLIAIDAVIAFTKYGTGITTGSTLTGNKTP